MGRTYNRYQGNTGRVERREDFVEPAPAAFVPPPPPPPFSPPPPPEGQKSPGSPPPLGGELGALLRRLAPGRLETEDLLLALIFYLLYRESGDTEWLLLAGGMILF